MNIQRALRLRDELVSSYRTIFSTAEHFGQCHDTMLAKRNEALAKLPKTTPRWVRDFASGVWSQLQQEAYNRLVYGGWVNGKFYSTHRNRADYYEPTMTAREWHEQADQNTRGHYWIVRDEPKPFFTSTP